MTGDPPTTEPIPRALVRCPAKVNLFLEVLGKRADGFHELSTVLTTIALFDDLVLTPGGDRIALTVTGDESIPRDGTNLVHRAAAAFAEEFHRPGGERFGVGIHLTKRIPAMTGLGGGSSDAAGAMIGLRELFRPDLDLAELTPLAASIGSDVPFFLTGGVALGTGRGEAIAPLPRPEPFWLVLLFPGFGLSTPDVYRALVVPAPEERRSAGDFRTGREGGPVPRDSLFNRLEVAAARIEPRVKAWRRTIEGHLLTGEKLLMTGSGSAHFVLVPDLPRAAELAAGVNRVGPGRALAVKAPAVPEPPDL